MPEPPTTRVLRLERAAALRDADELEAAASEYRALAADDPADAEPLHHLGGVLARQGALDEAEHCYRRAMALAPEAMVTQRALAILLLSQGRFSEGFRLFEARHEMAQYAKPDLPYAEWRGEPLADKRLLIWPEQGFGDQIQFARFAAVARAQGAEVTLMCWPALQRLFASSLGVQVIAAEGAVEFPDPDYWVMTMSLAQRFGATPQTLPSEPYLFAPRPQARTTGSRRRVGLVTRGSATFAANHLRSLDQGGEAALRALPAEVVGLTPEETGAQDFADTADIIAGLDLVISTDTSVAHLAGAMGKPCWVLLPAAWVDWRWMRERRDSPWYPSMRLYRQTRPGDWNGVVETVRRDFDRL